MSVRVLLAVSAGLLIAPGDHDPPSDDAAIQGTWIVESAERDGQPFERPVGDKVTFKEGTISIERKDPPETEQGATYTLDPATMPKAIDITPPNRDRAGL